jgi:hypothetical protein
MSDGFDQILSKTGLAKVDARSFQFVGCRGYFWDMPGNMDVSDLFLRMVLCTYFEPIITQKYMWMGLLHHGHTQSQSKVSHQLIRSLRPNIAQPINPRALALWSGWYDSHCEQLRPWVTNENRLQPIKHRFDTWWEARGDGRVNGILKRRSPTSRL